MLSTHACRSRYDGGMSVPNETLRDWLLDRLGERMWSRAELARAVGVDPSQITRWINGKDVPRRENCVRLADILAVHPNYVLALAGHEPLTESGVDLSDPLISFAAANQHRLTAEQKRALVELAKTMVAPRGGG